MASAAIDTTVSWANEWRRVAALRDSGPPQPPKPRVLDRARAPARLYRHRDTGQWARHHFHQVPDTLAWSLDAV